MNSDGEASGEHENLIEIDWEFSQEILLNTPLDCNSGEASGVLVLTDINPGHMPI